MAAFPQAFETERLRLRRISPADRDAVHAYATDPDVARFMTFPGDQSLDDITRFIERVQVPMDAGNEINWVIERKNTPGVIGGLRLSESPHGLEMGYILHRDHWGNGYVPEAARAAITWAFGNGFWRVWATCDVDNLKSAIVLQKVGMTYEGVLRRWTKHPNISDRPRDCKVYSIVR